MNKFKIVHIRDSISDITVGQEKPHMYHLENKGIVLKRAWFVRPDINTGATII